MFEDSNVLKTYNSKGQLLKVIDYGSYNFKNIEKQAVYTYDRKNNLTLIRTKNSEGELLSYVKNKYDKNHNLIQSERNEYQDRFIKYTYNEHNLILSEKIMYVNYQFFEDPDTGFYSINYFYDDSLRLIKKEDFNGDSILSYALYTYNNFGLKVKSTHYWKTDGSLRHTFYKYDENQRLIEENTHDDNMKFLYQIIYEYDDHGNVIRRTSYNSKREMGQVITYEYVYDSTGNWIRLTEKWSNQREYWRTYRTIEYNDN